MILLGLRADSIDTPTVKIVRFCLLILMDFRLNTPRTSDQAIFPNIKMVKRVEGGTLAERRQTKPDVATIPESPRRTTKAVHGRRGFLRFPELSR